MITGSAHSSTARGDYRRELFTVGGVRVTFDGRTWQCGCPDCEPDARCMHIDEAQRFRRLRCNPEHAAPPTQLSFDEPEFRVALEEFAARHPLPAHSAPPAIPPEVRPERATAVLAAGAAGACLAVFAYLSMMQPPRVNATAAVASPRIPAVELRRPVLDRPVAPTVKMVNPFDPSETFEFPPGTSEADARDSAATLLLERARQRLAAAAEHDGAL